MPRINSASVSVATDPVAVPQSLPSLPFEPCVGNAQTKDPCEERDVSRYDPLFPAESDARFTERGEPSVEDVLEQGLLLAGSSPVQLAIRGMATASSVRCERRGIARTPAQREQAIRFWLGLEEDIDPPTDGYTMSHPTIADSVMNYDKRAMLDYSGEDETRVYNEPGCSPHPFDVMALYALYQAESGEDD